MLLYENVCLYSKPITEHRKTGPVHRKQLRVMAFSDEPGEHIRANEVMSMYNAGNYEIWLNPDIVPLETGLEVTRNGGWTEGATLFTMQLHHNPGHCLSDMIFSIALDSHARNLTGTTAAPLYNQYAYGTWPKLWNREYEADWCFEVLRHAGYIQPEVAMVQPRHDGGSVCFRQLYVPIFGMHRFPVDTADVASVDAFRHVSVMNHFQMHDFTNPALQYPVEALATLRDSICQSVSLDCSSWSKRADEGIPKILIYNRRGSPRRHWTNAEQAQEMLQSRYNVEVDMLGEEWESMNTTTQLALYNQYRYILTVHGAHEANLITARAGSHVVEIQCLHPGDPHPDETQTTRVSNDPVGWYGPPSWFSIFSRRLGVQHFVFGETNGCTSATGQKGIHRSTNIVVETERFVDFVARRWGLQARATIL